MKLLLLLLNRLNISKKKKGERNLLGFKKESITDVFEAQPNISFVKAQFIFVTHKLDALLLRSKMKSKIRQVKPRGISSKDGFSMLNVVC